MTVVEFRRLFYEWRIRLQRVQSVLQPPSWSEQDWNHFARALSHVIQKYGSTWEADGVSYWDIRWDVNNGGQLICQFEKAEDGRKSLVVAQSGGFAEGFENYTWFYAEFGEDGSFLGDPYWIDGNWKDALAMILLPQQMGAGFYLNNSATPLQNPLLPQGAMAQLSYQ